MAERETVHAYVASRGRDASIYFRSETCLSDARDLLHTMGWRGVVSITGDWPGAHRDSWRWSSSTPPTSAEEP